MQDRIGLNLGMVFDQNEESALESTPQNLVHLFPSPYRETGLLHPLAEYKEHINDSCGFHIYYTFYIFIYFLYILLYYSSTISLIHDCLASLAISTVY